MSFFGTQRMVKALNQVQNHTNRKHYNNYRFRVKVRLGLRVRLRIRLGIVLYIKTYFIRLNDNNVP